MNDLAPDSIALDPGNGSARADAPLGLGALRRLRGASQSEVASAMGTTQSSVSRTERQPDVLLSTLRQYVDALGGRVRIFAELDGVHVELDLPHRQASNAAGREFRVVWQDPTTRSFRHIGWLRFVDGLHRFSYTDDARQSDAFVPFPQFPNVHDEYHSKELWPFFSGRVMSATAPQFPELANALGLTPTTATPVELLALGPAETSHDTIHVVPEPTELEDGRTQRAFLVSGVRHAGKADPDAISRRVGALTTGELLLLVAEPTNPTNPEALQLTAGGQVVGWVPNYLLDEVHQHLGAGRSLTFTVLRANGPDTPWHLRLLAQMTAAAPE